MTLLWWMLGSALAGSGPWVVGEGAASLYLGTEIQRLSRLRIEPGEEGVIEVGEGLSRFGVKAITSIGLSPRLELQLSLPWYRSSANRADHPLCDALGLGACRTTTGLGLLEARGKVLVLDEFFGSPVSLAVGTDLRVGAFTHPDRERITNIGEGTTDAGAFVSVGRSGGLGAGLWSAYLEGIGRYRFPNTDTYPQNTGTNTAPGSEVGGAFELLVGPTPFLSFGPVSYGLYRPSGLEWEELDLTDPDRLGALRIGTLRAGGLLVVRSRGDVSGSLAILRTVAAYNNPTDTFLVSLGLQVDARLRRLPDE